MLNQMFEQILADAAKFQPQKFIDILKSIDSKGFCVQNHFNFWVETNSYQQMVEIGIHRSGEMYSSVLYTWRNNTPLPSEEEIKQIVLNHLSTLPPAFQTWALQVKDWTLIYPVKEIVVDEYNGCVWFKTHQHKTMQMFTHDGYDIHEQHQYPRARSLEQAVEVYSQLTKPKPKAKTFSKPILKKDRK